MTQAGLLALALRESGCASVADFARLTDEDRALWMGLAWCRRSDLWATHAPPRE